MIWFDLFFEMLNCVFDLNWFVCFSKCWVNLWSELNCLLLLLLLLLLFLSKYSVESLIWIDLFVLQITRWSHWFKLICLSSECPTQRIIKWLFTLHMFLLVFSITHGLIRQLGRKLRYVFHSINFWSWYPCICLQNCFIMIALYSSDVMQFLYVKQHPCVVKFIYIWLIFLHLACSSFRSCNGCSWGLSDKHKIIDPTYAN